MPFITQGKANIKYILIVVILAAIVGGGILGYQYWWVAKKENTPPEIKLPEAKALEIKILATLPPEDPNIIYNIILDPEDTTIAYSIEDSAKSSATVVINGKKGQSFKQIDELTVSPDGKRVAFIAKKDEKEFVVVDGQEGKKYDYITNLKISSDSQHIAYAAGNGIHFVPDSPYSGSDWTNNMFIVVDGREGPKYGGRIVAGNIEPYNPFFSKDGEKVVYAAVKNDKNIIILDDKELSQYSSQESPQFIGESYDIAYLGSDGSKYFLIVGGEKKQVHDYISGSYNSDTKFILGKDKTQIAYEATDKNSPSIIVNDVSYPASSSTSSASLSDFSFSDGGNFAYTTSRTPGGVGSGTIKELFINGKIAGTIEIDPRQADLTAPVFSPNEKLVAFSELKQGNLILHFISVDPVKKIKDISLSDFKGGGPLRFSNDGKYLYFKGMQGRNIVFITLDVEQATNNY